MGASTHGERRNRGGRGRRGVLVLLTLVLAGAGAGIGPPSAAGQIVTVGGGAVFTEGSTRAVGEIHASAPPLVASFRPYATFSWTTRSWSPVIITAAERTVLRTPISTTGLGGGAVWFDVDGYEPYPLAVSSTVIPLAAPKTSLVLIGSTRPFQDFSWSVVAKLGVAILGGG